MLCICYVFQSQIYSDRVLTDQQFLSDVVLPFLLPVILSELKKMLKY